MHTQSLFKVKVHQHVSLLDSKFCGPTTHQEYQEAMLQVVGLVKNHHLLYWLLDATRTRLTLQDQRWGVQVLEPLIYETTLKKVAMVHQDDIFLEVAADNMRNKIYNTFDDYMELEHFATIADALNWLAPGVPAETLQLIVSK